MFNFTLNFHGIGETSRPLERNEEVVWLARSRFADILDFAVGEDGVRITFDDGNESDFTEALEPLLVRGLPSVHFVLLGRVGCKSSLSKSQLLEMLAVDRVIGSHGVAHRDWRKLSDKELIFEAESSKLGLEDLLGVEVVDVACPFGSYDRRVLTCLKEVGYKTVYTSDANWSRANSSLQHRLSVKSWHSPVELRELIDRDPHGLRAMLGRGRSLLKAFR